MQVSYRTVRRRRRPALVAAVALTLATFLLAGGARAAIPGSAFRWHQVASRSGAGERLSGGIAYDVAEGRLVLFGGRLSGQPQGDTWAWQDSAWHELGTPGSPPVEYAPSIAYDGATGELLYLYTPAYEPGHVSTWRWTAGSWRETGARTPELVGSALAYDFSSGQMIAYGLEEMGPEEYVAGTWSWEGGAWVRLSPPASPPVLAPYLAYDESDSEIVLYGAEEEASSSQTWTWDGTTWTERHPATVPPNVYGESLAYDGASGEVVLFGGEGLEGGQRGEAHGTWTWDGEEWTRHDTGLEPPGRNYGAMGYDSGEGRLLLLGGLGPSEIPAETWAYEPLPPPLARIGAPADGTSYPLGASVPTSFSCSEGEGGPGLEACLDSSGVAGGEGRLATGTPGPHTYTVTARSKDGRATTTSIDYTVQAPSSPSSPSPTSPVRPAVGILHRPRRGHRGLGHGRPRYGFRFGSQVPGARFECRLDATPFRSCGSPTVYRDLRPGRHVFAVRAIGPTGERSPSRKVTFVAAGLRRTRVGPAGP